MSALKAFIAKLRLGATASAPIIPAVCTSLPTFTGGAYTGNTVTAVHGVWDHPVFQYETGWFITPFPFDNLTQIAGATGLTYTYQAGDVGNKVCYGERVLTTSGWSQWAYSVLSGIVSATPVMSPPTITAGATATPSSGLKVGDVIQINAPTISNASDWWISIEIDGVRSEPIADFSDIYPLNYIMQAGDVSTTWRLITFASNGAGTVNNDTTAPVAPNMGPVSQNTALTIQDLGGADATENFILSLLAINNWQQTGSPTQTRTVTSPDELVALWTSQVLPGSMAERWEITLDWDGLLVWGASEWRTDAAGNNAYLRLDGPVGTAAWKDAGGWVHLKAAAGKRPGFLNQVGFSNTRGIILDGIDLCGRFNPNATSGSTKTAVGQACLKIGGFRSNEGEGVTILHNCRVGRYVKTLNAIVGEYILGVWQDGTQEQLVVDTCAFAGNFCDLKIPGRRAKIYNSDFSKGSEDHCKTYPQTKSGYYALYHYDKCTIRDQIVSLTTASYHSDLFQTATNKAGSPVLDNCLGTIMLMTDCWDIRDHKYGGSGGGATQGFQIANPAGHNDHLFCVRRTGIMVTSPNGFSAVSGGASKCSYLDRVTLGRAGITPSLFDGDLGSKDWSPGLNQKVQPQRSGVAFRVNDCLIGSKGSTNGVAWVAYSNTAIVDYTVAKRAPIPEDVFLGPSFERGTAATANNIANKFGYQVNNASQATFIAWIITNLTPKSGYNNQGAPPPNPANYSAPALG